MRRGDETGFVGSLPHVAVLKPRGNLYSLKSHERKRFSRKMHTETNLHATPHIVEALKGRLKARVSTNTMFLSESAQSMFYTLLPSGGTFSMFFGSFLTQIM